MPSVGDLLHPNNLFLSFDYTKDLNATGLGVNVHTANAYI